MNNDFESQEKLYVRQHLWDIALEQLLKSRNTIKVFELLGPRWKFWEDIRTKNPQHDIVVDGVTLEGEIEQKETYRHVFNERYDLLVKNESFLTQFPYDLINLDYCGGGRFYDEKYRYFKIPEIAKTIEINAAKIDSFYFLLTLDTADLIYPLVKNGSDVVMGRSESQKAIEFLEGIENLDARPVWLMILGNALEIFKICEDNNLNIELIAPPYTYIGESVGHKTRMISFGFKISHGKVENSFLDQLKKAVWLICTPSGCENRSEKYL